MDPLVIKDLELLNLTKDIRGITNKNTKDSKNTSKLELK
jgi:hypothetical protein